MLGRLVRDMPAAMRGGVSHAQAEAYIREGLEARAARLVQIVDRAIYARPASPFARLLRNAAVERGDLLRLITAEGVEGALGRLADAGVYVTGDEMKGRRAAVRGSQSFWFAADEFDNPLRPPHFVHFTSGTGGKPARIRHSLAFARWTGLRFVLELAAHDVDAARIAFWQMAPLHMLLGAAMAGIDVVGWFAPVRPLPWRAVLGAELLRGLSWAGGKRLPRLQSVEVDEVGRMLDWATGLIGDGKPLVLYGTSSSLTRIALLAAERGQRLPLLVARTTGEPLSAGRRDSIDAVGSRAMAGYGSAEVGGIATSCPHGTAADDLHVFTNMCAVISRRGPWTGEGAEIDALLQTVIDLEAPKILINHSPGDTARLFRRDCGCSLGDLGLTTHLADIRSFEKVTSEGASIARSRVHDAIERELPARFGGSPMDYQLVESIDAGGRGSLELWVAPSVAGVDDARIGEALLEALASSDALDRHHVALLQRAGALRVRRQVPTLTPAGKFLPFRIVRE